MKKKIESILCIALAASLLCSCNAVTPGPVTTRSQGTSIVLDEPEETETAAAEETTEAETAVSLTESSAGEEAEETQAEEISAGTSGEEENGAGPETETEAAFGTQTGDEAGPLPEEEEEEEEISLGGEGVVYARSAVNVRDAPGTDSAVVGTLMEGEAVKKLGEDGSWVMIEYNDTTCYVYRDYLTEEP